MGGVVGVVVWVGDVEDGFGDYGGGWWWRGFDGYVLVLEFVCG